MPIEHLLYRCPRCGSDTTTRGKGVRCEACGTTFEQGDLAVITVRSADGTVEETSARAAIDAIERFGGASPATHHASRELSYETPVAVAKVQRYEAVRWRGRLLGFWERFPEERPARLGLGDGGLTLTAIEQGSRVWPWAEISALQVSSGAIQLDIRRDGLYQVQFLVDSPKRWKELLEGGLRRFYAQRGQTVIEFQPRIVTRPHS